MTPAPIEAMAATASAGAIVTERWRRETIAFAVTVAMLPPPMAAPAAVTMFAS
jgi:hypothetical protein